MIKTQSLPSRAYTPVQELEADGCITMKCSFLEGYENRDNGITCPTKRRCLVSWALKDKAWSRHKVEMKGEQRRDMCLVFWGHHT